MTLERRRKHRCFTGDPRRLARSARRSTTRSWDDIDVCANLELSRGDSMDIDMDHGSMPESDFTSAGRSPVVRLRHSRPLSADFRLGISTSGNTRLDVVHPAANAARALLAHRRTLVTGQ